MINHGLNPLQTVAKNGNEGHKRQITIINSTSGNVKDKGHLLGYLFMIDMDMNVLLKVILKMKMILVIKV